MSNKKVNNKRKIKTSIKQDTGLANADSRVNLSKTLNTFTICFTICFSVYHLSGKNTQVNSDFLSNYFNLSVAQAISYVLNVFLVLLIFWLRAFYKKRIAELTDEKTKIELKIDPKKQTSYLQKNGDKKRGD